MLGAGARGELNLGTLVKRHPDVLRFTAVAEPHDGRREQFIQSFGIRRENAFRDWRELVQAPRMADAILNALPCRMHYESALGGLRAGYHTLLEKPMALTPGQCLHMTELAENLGLTFMVSLQSRYNRIYTRARSLVDQGTVGRMMAIDCAENIGYWHFIMSYVRGIHHRTTLSHSFLLAKGVHDLDLVAWFAGAPARRISSFGSLEYFHEGNAPEGAPERCTDGCPVYDTCVCNAVKQFVDPGKPSIPLRLLTGMSLDAAYDFFTKPRFRTLGAVIEHDISKANLMRAMRETEYGRCVFRTDNDVVDHQTVSIEFENGVTASFQLNGFSLIWERTLNLHGTEGEIISADFSGRLESRTYNPARASRERIPYHGIIHGGGDEWVLLAFAEAVQNKSAKEPLVSARNCLESHYLCFAAEEARVAGKVVDMEEFRQRSRQEAQSL